ncbi:hypothetical protein AVEN_121514-1 [Araneus ventricosus]|uniref:Uncharacterized protein n=1 Tax=Araneus ventricosus TaxID=182803 RepID=A0A4Y2W3I4_ARAVE|nr:hypothetical protein AVEN_121514-1 [Araneus ventricosus]
MVAKFVAKVRGPNGAALGHLILTPVKLSSQPQDSHCWEATFHVRNNTYTWYAWSRILVRIRESGGENTPVYLPQFRKLLSPRKTPVVYLNVKFLSRD